MRGRFSRQIDRQDFLDAASTSQKSCRLKCIHFYEEPRPNLTLSPPRIRQRVFFRDFLAGVLESLVLRKAEYESSAWMFMQGLENMLRCAVVWN
jgi:hypothetical protein